MERDERRYMRVWLRGHVEIGEHDVAICSTRQDRHDGGALVLIADGVNGAFRLGSDLAGSPAFYDCGAERDMPESLSAMFDIPARLDEGDIAPERHRLTAEQARRLLITERTFAPAGVSLADVLDHMRDAGTKVDAGRIPAGQLEQLAETLDHSVNSWPVDADIPGVADIRGIMLLEAAAAIGDDIPKARKRARQSM